jgi:uncharacterized integral membrane protein (TIGR00698 family)
MTVHHAKQAASKLEQIAIPVLVGFLCLLIGNRVPAPLVFALVIGAVVANVVPVARAESHAKFAKIMLRCGVVLVALRLPLGDIIDLGIPGFAVIVITMAVTYTVTCFVGDKLRLDRGLTTMIASGFSVCGAAAIAAVEGAVKRRNEDVALAVAMVTIFGTALVVLEPLVAGWLRLSDRRFGMWVGASIHEVAQVVAAASAAGASAVAIATTIKLGRVASLAFVYLAARRRDDTDRGTSRGTSVGRSMPAIPWFVAGFLIAVAIRSTGILPTGTLRTANNIATVLLAAGMFGLGLGLRLRALFPIPIRVLVLSLISTLTAAGASAAVIAVLA